MEIEKRKQEVTQIEKEVIKVRETLESKTRECLSLQEHKNNGEA